MIWRFVTIAVAAAIFSGAGVWSLPARAQTPMIMYWDTGVAGPGGYQPVSTTHPLPITPIAGGTPFNVNLTQIGGVAVLAGAGATGTGSVRDTVAQDTTTIAGSAPGTAGSPSANVVTVQGPTTSGTDIPVNVDKWAGGAPPSLGTGIVGVAVAPTATAAAGITPVVSTALEASHVLDASPGNLYSVSATNLTGGISGNMQVFNATSAPGDGAVTPLFCVPFDSLGKAQAFFSPGPPAAFSTGITVVASSATSCFTKTTGVITAMFVGMSK